MELYCDGLCEPQNPGGHATWGFVATDDAGQEVHAACGYIGHGPGMTNNVAEYTAVIEALKWAYTAGHRGFTVKTDSQLVVNQVRGEWQVKAAHLDALVARVRNGLAACEAANRITWVPREQNARADALSRQAYAPYVRTSTQVEPPSACVAVYVAAVKALDTMDAALAALDDGFETNFIISMMERITQYGDRTYISEKQQAVIRRMVETYLGVEQAAEWFHGQTRLLAGP